MSFVVVLEEFLLMTNKSAAVYWLDSLSRLLTEPLELDLCLKLIEIKRDIDAVKLQKKFKGYS